MPEVLDGAALITAERHHQVDVEGFTGGHDDDHEAGELVLAAYGYLTEHDAFGGEPCGDDPPEAWPWGPKWWKPSPDPVRNLVKAGALIAAEIDRLQRAGATHG